MREEILRLLERNGRIDLSDAAKMLGMTEVDLANEIAKMEKEQIICGYTTLINWDKTSAEKVTALIEVKVTPQRGRGFSQFAEKICQYPEVESMYLLSGNYDFMVILQGRTMREVARFVSDKLAVVDSVLSTSTLFVLKKYKDHGSILESKPKSERRRITL